MARQVISAEFRAWLAPMLVPLPELPDGMEYNDMLQPSVYCSVCGNLFEWPCEVSEYDPESKEHNYCGGSPRCCP